MWWRYKYVEGEGQRGDPQEIAVGEVDRPANAMNG